MHQIQKPFQLICYEPPDCSQKPTLDPATTLRTQISKAPYPEGFVTLYNCPPKVSTKLLTQFSFRHALSSDKYTVNLVYTVGNKDSKYHSIEKPADEYDSYSYKRVFQYHYYAMYKITELSLHQAS